MCRCRFCVFGGKMDREEKLSEAKIVPEGKFLRWFDNFWYHYKWPTIIVSFFVIVLLVCTLQMCTNEKEDITLAYAGPAYLTANDVDNIKKVMNHVMPEDFDNNGEKTSAFVHYQIYSEEQIKNIQKEHPDEDIGLYIDRAYNSNNYDEFYKYIQTGESSVCLIDPSLFEALKENNRILELSEVLGYTPENSIDNYGLRLGDLAIYDEYSVLKKLPEDTVVCILRSLVVGKSSKPKLYAQEMDMFSAIVEFGDEK